MSIAVFTSFQQVCDNAGNPLDGGSVTVYSDGTTTLIQLYYDEDLAGGHETGNPITLDAYGRHDMAYFSTQAYKVLVKDSGGSTIFTRDVIDPGVPVGTGVLPIANGGTGASNGATALSNLGGATSAELAALSAEVASISGALGSTEKTHIATGTAAQRPAAPIEGDIRRNIDDSVWEGYNGAAWENFVIVPTGVTDYSATTSQEGLIQLATNAEQKAGTAADRGVTSLNQNQHPSAAKAWALVTSGGTVTVGYNVTSVSHDSTGDWTVTLTNAFSTANYAVIITARNATAVNLMSNPSRLAGSFTVKAESTAASDQDTDFMFACYGELA